LGFGVVLVEPQIYEFRCKMTEVGDDDRIATGSKHRVHF
jgi:hypothetical protein